MVRITVERQVGGEGPRSSQQCGKKTMGLRKRVQREAVLEGQS